MVSHLPKSNDFPRLMARRAVIPARRPQPNYRIRMQDDILFPAMTKMHTEVISAALALPPAVRAELAEELLNSLEDQEQQAIDTAWADEAERRVDQLDNGTAKLVPGDEVMAKLRKRF